MIAPEILAQIIAPTKLIWGENDPMAGSGVAKTFLSQLPNAGLELWPNTGHAPWIDDPIRAANSISDFLIP